MTRIIPMIMYSAGARGMATLPMYERPGALIFGTGEDNAPGEEPGALYFALYTCAPTHDRITLPLLQITLNQGVVLFAASCVLFLLLVKVRAAMISDAPLCDGCEYGNVATRRIRLETYSRSQRVLQRNSCDECWQALDRPETLGYICQDCGSVTTYSNRLCTACSVVRALQEMQQLIRGI
jgi:hypothetical protein